MLLDTEGSYAPVQAQQPGAMAARQETESLVEELIVRVCDYLVYVVDDFTSVDQRAVHRLAARLAERKQGFSELIVVHNLRTVADEVAFEHMWRTQILELYEEAGEELEGVVPIKAVNNISSASGSGEKKKWRRQGRCRIRVIARFPRVPRPLVQDGSKSAISSSSSRTLSLRQRSIRDRSPCCASGYIRPSSLE